MRQTIQNANASLYCDGNAGYLTMPITPSPTGFSFGMWVKTGKRTTASVSVLLSSNSAAFTDGFWFGKGNGRSEFEFVGYNTTNSISPALRTSQVSDGVWAHVVVTYLPSGSCSIYLNGVLSQTVTATNTISTGTTTIYVGRRSYTATFAGLNVSQLVWHNTTTPWTAAQVLALYQSGTIPTGATAVYPLNEGGGSIAYDTSGNGNNGTITSGTWSKDAPTKTRKGVNGNMVYNGDFEIAPVVNVPQTSGGTFLDGTATGSTNNNVFGWANYLYSGTRSAQFDTSVSYSGRASLKLSTLAANSGIGVGTNTSAAANARLNNIPILPNTSYTASVRVKTSLVSGSSTTGVRVSAQTFLGDMITSVTATDLVTGLVTTQDWTQYTATFTTGATARFININCSVTGTNGAATLIMDAWFDDIQLYPTTAITRSAATGRSTAGTRLSA